MSSKIIPKTRIEDYVSFRDELDVLEREVVNKKVSAETFCQKRDALVSHYHGRVHFEDKHLFNNETQYRDFLEKVSLPPQTIDEIIDHERSHFDSAKQLRFKTQYGIWWCVDGYGPFVRITEIPNSNERRQIATSVDNPSILDY
ncbi:hypothetical protein HOE04_05405 [archaeon]|jgi:hypothetical protein|nr:hypothetical protein [archaeon]